jgi:hypothetical protein
MGALVSGGEDVAFHRPLELAVSILTTMLYQAES